MNKIAVLGSSGQIGSHLVKFLEKKGYEVDGYDIVPSETTNTIFDLRTRFLNFTQYKFIYFLAFDVGGSRYLKAYQHTPAFMNNNMRLMSNIFHELERSKTSFIFASSQMASMSYSPYGLLKQIGEEYTKALKGMVVKFWNVYGVEKDLEKAHVITDFITKAKTGKIDMMTDGTEVRQMLYAEDCCECLDILSKRYNDIDRDKLLHITNFKWNTILEIAKYVSSHFEDCIIEPGLSKDEVQKDVRNEPDDYILNFWKPKTSLKDGIASIVELT